MISITAQGNHKEPYVMELVADKDAELADLATFDCAPGSSCLVIESGDIYMKDSKGNWVAL